MRKITVLCFAFLVSFLNAEASSKKQVLLLLSNEDTIAPFSMDKGKKGIIVDLYHEIFKNSEYSLKINVLPDARLKKELLAGVYSHWLSFGAKGWYNPKKYKKVSFSDIPLVRSHEVLIVKKGQNVSFPLSRKMNLLGIRGFLFVSPLLDQKNISLTYIHNVKAAFKMLKLGRVDGFVHNSFNIDYLFPKDRDFNVIELPASSQNVVLMWERQDKKLGRFVESRLHTLKSSGKVSEIINKYLFPSKK